MVLVKNFMLGCASCPVTLFESLKYLKVWQLLVQGPTKQKMCSAVENIFSTFQVPLWPGKGETGRELLFERVFPGVFNY